MALRGPTGRPLLKRETCVQTVRGDQGSEVEMQGYTEVYESRTSACRELELRRPLVLRVHIIARRFYPTRERGEVARASVAFLGHDR